MASRTAEDERFIESFKNYVDLLVDESCSELMGKEPVPKDKFEGAGHKLVEASRSLKTTQKVEGFVGLVNSLAENKMLAPLMGLATTSLESYFEEVGLRLWNGGFSVEGRTVSGMCLGETKTIDMYVGPKVTVFTKTLIENTSDTIRSRMLGVRVTSDWADNDEIFHMLEPKLDYGRATWSRLKTYSSLKSMSEKTKLDKLAWTALSLECGDEEAFSKKYASTSIEDNYPHEIYHNQIAKSKGGDFIHETAAQLYAVSRGSNPFNCLQIVYGWKDCKMHTYAHAAEEAFTQLKKAGYKESVWNELDPRDTEKVNAARSEIRKLAEVALTTLETDLGWKNHNEVERELGLEGNYSILHKELQTLYEK